jgi:hypothetical protein
VDIDRLKTGRHEGAGHLKLTVHTLLAQHRHLRPHASD